MFVYFCVATILAQLLGIAYVTGTGKLDRKSVTGFVQGIYGVDEQLANKTPTSETPEELETRVTLDAVRRLRAHDKMNNELIDLEVSSRLQELKALKEEVQEQRDRYDALWNGFQKQLVEMRDGAVAKGKADVRKVWENVKAKQAKDQIIARVKKDGGLEEVVEIISSMPIDASKKIIGAFKTDEEKEVANKIIDMMLKGDPEASWADQTKQQLDESGPR